VHGPQRSREDLAVALVEDDHALTVPTPIVASLPSMAGS
jgi:hypothetical protein